jgi:hypothetical protein
MVCKNCQEELTGNEKFCSNCGQKNIDQLDLRYILSQFVEDIFNVDSKVFKTLKCLTFSPGQLTTDYMSGKRATYVPPVRLYIVMSVIFFFFISLVDLGDAPDTNFSVAGDGGEVIRDSTDIIDGVKFTVDGKTQTISTSDLKRMEYEGTLEEGLDSLTAEMPTFAAYLSKKAAIAKVNDDSWWDTFFDHASIFLIIFLPFFALMYGTIFSGSKKGFVGHLIFNLHLNSFIMFSLIINFLIDMIMPGDLTTVDVILFMSFFLFGQYYLIRGVMRFYLRTWWVALYKYILLIFGYAILALVFMIFVMASSLWLI